MGSIPALPGKHQKQGVRALCLLVLVFLPSFRNPNKCHGNVLVITLMGNGTL